MGVGYLAENWLLTCSGKASVSNELDLLTNSKVYRSKSTLKFGIQLKLLFFDLFKALKKLILDSHPNFTEWRLHVSSFVQPTVQNPKDSSRTAKIKKKSSKFSHLLSSDKRKDPLNPINCMI